MGRVFAPLRGLGMGRVFAPFLAPLRGLGMGRVFLVRLELKGLIGLTALWNGACLLDMLDHKGPVEWGVSFGYAEAKGPYGPDGP